MMQPVPTMQSILNMFFSAKLVDSEIKKVNNYADIEDAVIVNITPTTKKENITMRTKNITPAVETATAVVTFKSRKASFEPDAALVAAITTAKPAKAPKTVTAKAPAVVVAPAKAPRAKREKVEVVFTGRKIEFVADAELNKTINRKGSKRATKAVSTTTAVATEEKAPSARSIRLAARAARKAAKEVAAAPVVAPVVKPSRRARRAAEATA